MVSLATVYIVWGSSFLFTKIAVSNLPIAYFRRSASSPRDGAGAWWRASRKRTLARRRHDWSHVIIADSSWCLPATDERVGDSIYSTNESALLNGTAAFWIGGLGVFGPAVIRSPAGIVRLSSASQDGTDADTQGDLYASSLLLNGRARRLSRIFSGHAVLPSIDTRSARFSS